MGDTGSSQAYNLVAAYTFTDNRQSPRLPPPMLRSTSLQSSSSQSSYSYMQQPLYVYPPTGQAQMERSISMRSASSQGSYSYPQPTLNASEQVQYMQPDYGNPTFQVQSQYDSYPNQASGLQSPPYFVRATNTGYASSSPQQLVHVTSLPPSQYAYPAAGQPSTIAMSPGRDSSASEEAPSRSPKRYPCTIEGCVSAFNRPADRQRHIKTVHFKEENRVFSCDAPRCKRKGPDGFTREDHLNEHKRNYHHRNIPKRCKGRGVDEDQPIVPKEDHDDDYADTLVDEDQPIVPKEDHDDDYADTLVDEDQPIVPKEDHDDDYADTLVDEDAEIWTASDAVTMQSFHPYPQNSNDNPCFSAVSC